jgi:transcription initiation factor IIE alpha subunit
MNRYLFLLFLFVSFFANAQDGISFYPDALAFKGDVLTVKMYSSCTKGEKCDLADIEYVYDEHVRIVRTYDSLPEKGIRDRERLVEPLTKNPKDDKVIVYINGFNRLEAEHYSFDESGNKTFTCAEASVLGYKSVLSYDKEARVIKRVQSDAHKAITDITTYSYSDNGKTIQLITTDAVGKMIGKLTRKLDEHDNPIFCESENFIDKQKGITRFKYSYDSHGNYTSFTTTYNGGPSYSHYRQITYK